MLYIKLYVLQDVMVKGHPFFLSVGNACFNQSKFASIVLNYSHLGGQKPTKIELLIYIMF